MIQYIKKIAPAAAMVLTLGISSCTGDLDVEPIDPSSVMTVDEVALYTKCYATMALAGNTGANGDCDIDGLDGGTSGFVRQLINANELTTDEAICAWGDPGIPAFNYNQYDDSHPMLKGMYYRLTNSISYCNHYLDVCKGMNEQREAEVRFLRALYYYYMMDLYGNVPFATEVSTIPQQIKRADLFAWIEAELLGKAVSFKTYSKNEPSGEVTREAGNAILDKLSEPSARTSKDKGYNTADQDAANLLLARLYLNAEVYTGTARWKDALDYAEIVINGKHKLWTTSKNGWSPYQMLFMGDNGENGSSQEAILALYTDGKTTTNWCSSLFLMASTWKADMDVDGDYNTSECWAGNRARAALLEKFFPNGDAPQVSIADMAIAAGDNRALFYGVDRTLEVTTPSEFTSGYSIGKFRNTYITGEAGHNSQFPDMDVFLMRSAEAYLIAAEADARLNNGQATAKGIGYINELRKRAKAKEVAACSLRQILDERSRELYYEGHRRTDLIRYGLYNTSDYLWEWKGGAQNGTGFQAELNIFAIPTEDLLTNPNLTQNPGY